MSEQSCDGEGLHMDLSEIYLDRLYDELENDFALYEQGRITISEYSELIEVKLQDFERQRTALLGLKEQILVWFNRILGRHDRWHEAAEALEWCRIWARDQRHGEITTWLQSARASNLQAEALQPGDLMAA